MPRPREYSSGIIDDDGTSTETSLATAEKRVQELTNQLNSLNANPNSSSYTKNVQSLVNRLDVANTILLKEIQNITQPSESNYTPLETSTFIPGGATSFGGATVVSTPLATPPKLPEVKTEVVKPPVKTAPIDTLLIDQDKISVDLMTDLIFEDIGGQELINVARNDTINGQTVSYQPIKNLTSIQQQYNPNNILSLQDTSDKYFINFPIKLETYLLNEGEGSGPAGAYVYIETETGDLIVELINLENDQQIEVQISQSGTIYEAEFNES